MKQKLSLIDEFVNNVKSYNLIEKNDKILVAVSGGVDSSVLLYILSNLRGKLEFELICATINHKIRRESSDEVLFVKNMAYNLNVPCYIHEVDAIEYSKKNKLSLEEAARILRYDYLYNLMKKINANKLATAHNLNDLVETVIFRLTRGSGPFGIYGLKPKSGNLIRPLLFFERKKIEQFAKENNISYVVDKSNFDVKYTRNYIRHEIVPMLKNINPSFERAVLRFVGNMWELEQFVERQIDIQTFEFDNRIFFKVPDDEYVLIEFIRRKTIEHIGKAPDKEKLDRLKKTLGKTSFKISFWNDYGVEISYGMGVIGKFIPKLKFKYIIDESNNFSEIKIGPFVVNFRKNGIIFRKLKFMIRNWENGDKTKGGKKLKEIFVLKKVPSFLRRIVPVFVDDENRVFYVPNVFLDKDYLVEDEKDGIAVSVEMKGGFLS